MSGAGPFVYDLPRVRVVFEAGAVRHLSRELDALGLRRALVITTAGRAEELAPLHQGAGDRVAEVAPLGAMHVPIDRVRAAVERADRVGADALVAYGGGSAIGLAKGVALERRSLPIVTVPTTYSGSEMTGIWGITDGAIKRTGRDAVVRPRVVVYDPMLTLSLPADVSAASGMNAVAHAVEAAYAPTGPVATACADEALRLLADALPVLVRRPTDLSARALALRGAHAAGVALDLASMGLHHRMCHVLGGTFGLPHARTHAAVLPHVVDFNAPAVPAAMARIAAALASDDAGAGIRALEASIGMTAGLRALGFDARDIDRAAELVTANPYPNPRPATRDDIRAILRAAL
jgi:maleylacetate reductase